MLNAIKQAALDALEASKPVAVLFGTVTKMNPLEVNVDQRFTLDADFLILPESLTRCTMTVNGTEYVVRRGLQAGDRVALLRIQGGQQYLIVDKVVVT
jgi:hypothetical protein